MIQIQPERVNPKLQADVDPNPHKRGLKHYTITRPLYQALALEGRSA